MRNICTSIVAMFVLAGTVHAQPVQWTVAEGGNGHWYQIVDGTGDSWNSHRESALSQGGDLACITSEGESQFINDLQSATGFCDAYVSLGGLQTQGQDEPDGGWYWISGEVWEYENWYAGEPNDGGSNEWGLAIFRYNGCNGQWCDIYPDAAGSGSMAFAIEWDHDPSIAQWRIEEGGNGHWYEGVSAPDGISWLEANEAANASGGYLATLTSAEEDQFVAFTVADPDWLWNWDGSVERGPWFGGFRTPEECDLSTMNWVTGEPWSYTRWHSGNPNEDCTSGIQFWNYSSRTWQDNHDDDPTRANGYIIEYTVLPGSALGACCLDGLCITTVSSDCEGHGGTWGGADSSCADFSCPISCSGDVIGGDGVVDINDLLIVIEGWGPCP